MEIKNFKKIFQSCDWIFSLGLLWLLSAAVLPGQALQNLLGAKPVSAAPVANDALGRTTPRGAIYGFLGACHDNQYELAARYLDLRKLPADQRQMEGPNLAKQLVGILDHEPKFEVEKLSDSPEGNVADGLAPDLERLVQLETSEANEPATIFLRRVKQQGFHVWMVDADSVQSIPDFVALEGQSPIEKHIPKVLVRHTLLGTPWWAWLALIGLTLLLFAFSRLLSRISLAIFEPIAKRFAAPLRDYRLDTLSGPLRLLVPVIMFRFLMELVTPSALLRDYLLKALAVLFVFGVAALIVRIIGIVSLQVQNRLGPVERALSYSVLPLGLRMTRIVIFVIAALVVLASFGYNTNAILAGLGVGGLAIALAAQKTIENLFGGIALISDRPVLVGDTCQFGGQVGTVEDIGLRSTRIRTPDRTLVTIPNANFSTMTIENYSRRDRIWFHPTLHLRRDTDPAKAKAFMDAISGIFASEKLILPSDVPARLTKITDYSLDVDLFAYVATTDYNEFLRVQSSLLLKLVEASDKLGVAFATPISESINVSPADANQKGS